MGVAVVGVVLFAGELAPLAAIERREERVALELPVDLGEVLSPVTDPLLVSIQPDTRSLVEIDTPIVFDFSEEIDGRSVNINTIILK